MIAYIAAAVAGGIVVAIILAIVRLASQRRKASRAFQESIRQALGGVREDNAQAAKRMDDMVRAVDGLRAEVGRLPQQGAGAELAGIKDDTREIIEKLGTAAGAVKELREKVDDLTLQAEIGGAVTFPFENRTSKLGTFTRSRPSSPVIFPQTVTEPVVMPKGARVAAPVESAEPAQQSGGPPGLINLNQPFPAIPIEKVFANVDIPADVVAPVAASPPVILSPDDAAVAKTALLDRRIVDLMYATNRAYDDRTERFTGERNKQITYGQAYVRIPEAHKLGSIERPVDYKLFGYTIYKGKEDPSQHFVIRGINILSKEEWVKAIRTMPEDDALVFVHGFHNSFEDALYRNAQIIWDLKFKGIAVLFSWPSRGAIADYLYDKDSALFSRPAFIEVLELLTAQPNIKRIHILAHSMGNLVVLDALANHVAVAAPLNLGELMMAAPDVDRDHYSNIAVKARKITKGMTLYASGADKALALSKKLAGDIPRAGDVPDSNGPIVLTDIDSIDATPLGEEIFGLNHSTFAQSRSILNDVFRLLKGERPPNARLADILSVPEDAIPPRYWRYASD